MKRIHVPPRANFEARAAELGFSFHTVDERPYWDETAYYAFTLKEIEDDLEAPSRELAALCLELAGRIVADEVLLQRLAIPRHAWDLIAASWRANELSLYGRFDFAYDGSGPAKLLEYNADTPTTLFEAAVFQWVWLEDAMAQNLIPPGCDQFNSLHERLVVRLKEVAGGHRLHLAAMLDNAEDRGFVAYLEACAREAGVPTTCLAIGDIGLDASKRFVDLDHRRIDCLFKLYPWEWMFADAFGKSPAMRRTRFVEPAWKAVLSNKGILPLLWEMAPGHPNLLPAYFEGDRRKDALHGRFVRKPLYSREGANVLIVDGGQVVAREDGTYGAEGYIVQGLANLPQFDGKFPVVGSWLVGADACGIGMREDDTPITRDTARFIPHAIVA